MAKTVTLWVDVPEEKRMTASDWHSCSGASDPDWIDGKISRYVEGEGITCAAAVRMQTWSVEKWHPCGHVTAEGEAFCPSHGGLRKIADAPRKPWVEVERARLERRKQTVLGRIERLQHDLSDIERSIDAITHAELMRST